MLFFAFALFLEVLNQSDIDQFNSTGYLVCEGVYSAKDGLAMQKEIRQELREEFGIYERRRDTWTTPSHPTTKAKLSPLNEKVINNNFRSIINDLLGKGNWKASWDDFLIDFPSPGINEWVLTNELWHWDYELLRLFDLKGLLIFSFYSEVPPEGGGTLMVKGSHRVLEHCYHQLFNVEKAMKHGAQRKHFMKWHPWFSELSDPETTGNNRKSRFMDKATKIPGS